MEFVRKVVNGSDLKEIIDIPTSLINKKVEILIFPMDEQIKKNKKRTCLTQVLFLFLRSERAPQSVP